ncbi:MAG: radical SAM protein [bacterium]
MARGEDLSLIQSIVYRLPDGEIAGNERAAEWVDLEGLPFPDWNMVDYRKYGYTILKKKPMVSIMTSRGCPNQCIYCTKLVHGHELRMRSVQNVVDEIERDHIEYGVREIQFMDDNLTASVPRLKEICEEIIRRGLNRKAVFGIPSGIRPDRGDREMFRLMKRAGFYFVVISVETADGEVSSKLRRGVDLDKVRSMISLARRAGLVVSTFYIFGTPFDTSASMRRSTDFACKSDANILSIFFMLPFPGTDVHDMLVKEGKIEPEDGEASLSYIGMKPVFEANDWTGDDLIAITRRAYKRFYFSPRRIVMNLFRLPEAFRNPLVLLLMLLKLFFHGTPVHERREQLKPHSRFMPL